MNTHLKAAEWLSHVLDEQFNLGPFKFGLDPIIGLFPIVGDIFTTILSLYIVWIGIQMKIPGNKIAEMVGNVVIDFLLDFIPILGQFADFAFKSNIRNLKIIKEYVKNENIVEGEIIR